MIVKNLLRAGVLALMALAFSSITSTPALAACPTGTGNTGSTVTATVQMDALKEICDKLATAATADTTAQTSLTAIAAGEFFVTNSPTTGTAAYVASDCIGGTQEFQVVDTNGQSGIVNRITMMWNQSASLTPTVSAYLFSSQPTTSCTDSSPVSFTAADFAKLITIQQLTFAAQQGTTLTEAESSGFAGYFQTSGNRKIYLILVSQSSFSSATSDLYVQLGGSKN